MSRHLKMKAAGEHYLHIPCRILSLYVKGLLHPAGCNNEFFALADEGDL